MSAESELNHRLNNPRRTYWRKIVPGETNSQNFEKYIWQKNSAGNTPGKRCRV
ncbi:MAG TPA: hypothetical protein PLL47_08965 [Methanosarcina sp.]|nr:hypothetical protein [Methanosarcina sp.]